MCLAHEHKSHSNPSLVLVQPRKTRPYMSHCALHTEAYLTLFILMDYPIHIDAISMELSILYSKGLPVTISIKMMPFCPRQTSS